MKVNCYIEKYKLRGRVKYRCLISFADNWRYRHFFLKKNSDFEPLSTINRFEQCNIKFSQQYCLFNSINDIKNRLERSDLIISYKKIRYQVSLSGPWGGNAPTYYAQMILSTPDATYDKERYRFQRVISTEVTISLDRFVKPSYNSGLFNYKSRREIIAVIKSRILHPKIVD